MADPEVTATLPLPESSQVSPNPPSAPPAVVPSARSTPEGRETQSNPSSLSTEPNVSVLAVSLTADPAPHDSEPRPPASSNLGTSDAPSAHDEKAGISSVSNGETVQTDSTLESPLTASSVVSNMTDSTATTVSAFATPLPRVVDSSSMPASTTTTTSTPHKRFTAVKVNRNFIQKSTTPSAPATSAHAGGAKPGTTHASAQPQASHSRLVTAKLTSLVQAPSTSTGVWRSAGPSAGPSSAVGTPPSQAATPTRLNHGKSSTNASSSTLKGDPKSSQAQAWGSKASSSVIVPKNATVEFPTAAEAANGKKARLETAAINASQNVIEAAAIKLQETVAADAFRGIHLDPKTHHWDEDGDDDDDFLNEVIDFGDGRQYTVKHGESPATAGQEMDDSSQLPPPMTQEDRFGDDIGRHWPPQAPSVASANPPGRDQRGQDHNGPRALFNERSNKFETAGPPTRGNSRHEEVPTNVAPRQFPPPPANAWGRRPSQGESQGGRWQHEKSSGNPNPRRPSISTHEGDMVTSPVMRTVSSLSHRGPPSPVFSTAGSNGPPKSRGPSFTEHSRDGRFSRSGDARHFDAPANTSTFREISHESIRDVPPHQNRNMPPPTTIPAHNRRPSYNARDLPQPLAPASNIAPPHAPPPHGERMRSPSISLSSPRSSHHMPTPLPQIPPLLPTDPSTLKAPTINDIQSFNKESMQTAAERARERRKLEEEQREKEKERARQKAAELAAAAEAKQAAEKAALEKAVAEKAAIEKAAAEKAVADKIAAERAAAEAAAEALIREETEKLVKENTLKASLASSTSSVAEPPSVVSSLWRVRSSRGGKRGSETKVAPPSAPRAIPASQDPTVNHPLPLVPSHSLPQHPPARQGSWANVVKVNDRIDPIAYSPSAIGGNSWRSKAAPAPSAPPKASTSLSAVQDVSAEEHDSLETIDFSDMGKFISDDQEETTLATTPEVVSPILAPAKLVSRTSNDTNVSSQSKEMSRPANASPPPMPTSTSSKGVGMTSPAASAQGLMSPQALANLPLPPSKQHFRETSMSALEDVMSRIKGALHTMRPGESNEDFDTALAAATAARKAVTDEAFAVTIPARPSSPLGHPPRHHKVRIRKQWPSRPHRPINERTLYLFKLPPKPVRMDILSWDPPIEGLSRKTLSRDEIHFSTSLDSNRVIVSLPSSSKAAPSTSRGGPVPRVNLPSSSSGKSPTPVRSGEGDTSRLNVPDTLDPMSRSPPPVSPSRRASLSLPKSSTSLVDEVAPAPAPPPLKTHAMNGRSKSISKPVGVDAVDFYKRHVATDSSSSLVTFTVTSDLESAAPAQLVDKKKEVPTKLIIDGSSTTEPTPASSSSSRPITPPPKSTSWAKSPLVYQPVDASSRKVAADPENIKSLWETNDKDVVTIENSLEGIVDEVPTFSIQDMKSDDGEDGKTLKAVEAPSPAITSAPPKRIGRVSVMDVNRAFQVPTSGDPEPALQTEPPKPPPTRNPNSSSHHPHPPHSIPHRQFSGFSQTVSPISPMIYSQQPFAVSPIGRPPNGHAVQQPSHIWMPVNPAGAAPMQYYRPPPYGSPIVYASPTLPSPYASSPISNLPKTNMSMSRTPSHSSRGTPANGTPQNFSPASAPSPMPVYMSGRATPGFYTPGVQQVQLPAIYPSSPGPMFATPPSTGSPAPTLYSSAPHGPYRPNPPTW